MPKLIDRPKAVLPKFTDTLLSDKIWTNNGIIVSGLAYSIGNSLSATLQGNILSAIKAFKDVANLNTSTYATFLAFEQNPSSAFSQDVSYSKVSNADSDLVSILIGANYNSGSLGSSFYPLLLRQLGEGLGLKRADQGVDKLPQEWCSSPWTVMVNETKHAISTKLGQSYLNTLGPLDIAAIQDLYGVNSTTNLGATDYKLDGVNLSGYTCIWDAGGLDTVNAAASVEPVTIDLRNATLSEGKGAGGFISSPSSQAYGYIIANDKNGLCIIENAIGSNFADVINGNTSSNRLEGKDGNDTLRGFGGPDDVIDGGPGVDLVILEYAKQNYSFEVSNGALVAKTGSETVRLVDIEEVSFDGSSLFGPTVKTSVNDIKATLLTNPPSVPGPPPAPSGVTISPTTPNAPNSPSSPLPEVFQQSGTKSSFTGTNPYDPIVGDNSGNKLIPLASGSFRISGKGGADDFVFSVSEAFGAKNADILVDFNADEGDKILLSRQVFKDLAWVDLRIVRNNRQLRKAASKASNIIYHKKTGGLYYNSNDVLKGLGGQGGLFAVVENLGELFESSFSVF